MLKSLWGPGLDQGRKLPNIYFHVWLMICVFKLRTLEACHLEREEGAGNPCVPESAFGSCKDRKSVV